MLIGLLQFERELGVGVVTGVHADAHAQIYCSLPACCVLTWNQTLVKRIAAKYSISMIYLATDDEDVARKAPVYYPTFTWIEQSHNRQIYSVPGLSLAGSNEFIENNCRGVQQDRPH